VYCTRKVAWIGAFAWHGGCCSADMHQLKLVGPEEGCPDLAELWRRLVTGQLFLSNSYSADGRCFGVIERRTELPPGAPPSMSNLERVLLGTSQKVLTHEFNVSNATIASQCARALHFMTSGHTVSRAPLLLVMAVHAAHGVRLELPRVESNLEGSAQIISCALPTASFSGRLTRCESAVAAMLIAGNKHEEIAAERGTSPRTTANQLASIFGKLGISGRGELRHQSIVETSRLLDAGTRVTALPTRISVGRPPVLSDRQRLSSIAV